MHLLSGESCGCDGDWRVTQNKKGVAAMEWYTGQECNFARVGADFFCPPSEAPISFGSSVHTCKSSVQHPKPSFSFFLLC
jgi:hypothetical protein